jgi:hypothetical protein
VIHRVQFGTDEARGPSWSGVKTGCTCSQGKKTGRDDPRLRIARDVYKERLKPVFELIDNDPACRESGTSDSFGDYYFETAWRERVLRRHPPIPYLRIVEMRSRKFREAHGLNEVQAEQLFLLTSEVDAGKFREVVASRNLPSTVETGT